MDIIFKNGKIYDGLGNKSITGNVGIRGDKIVYPVKEEDLKRAARVIDLEGLSICPGFINIHSHSDFPLVADGTVPSCIHQGITTEVTGNCGYSLAPLKGEAIKEASREIKTCYDMDITWSDFKEYFALLEEKGIALNTISLVGHGTLRSSVIGRKDRKATFEEIRKMKEELKKAMEDGAAGLSTGLIYPPGCYADTEEIIELSKTVSECHGFYSTHMRGEGDTLIEAVKEAVMIGKKANVPVEISHLKAAGEKNWGKTEEALSVINKAREEGLCIYHDQYPYTASATGLSMMVPSWAQDGGTEEFMKRLEDNNEREKIKAHMEEMAYKNGRNVLISYVPLEKNKKYEGQFVKDAAEEEGKEVFDFVLDLLLEEEGNVGAIYMSMNEEDVCRVMSDPHTMIGNDAGAQATEGVLHKGKPHPRTYGTFPRVLARYVGEKKLLTMEEAIRKMTSLPAKMLGLKDRGIIKDGYFADLVIFNPENIKDTATFKEPHSYPEGIEHVVVNGKIVLEKGKMTEVKAGKVLRNPMVVRS